MLSGDIKPRTIKNPKLSQYLEELRNRFYHHLNVQGFSREAVRDVEIELIFIPELPAGYEKTDNWRPFYHCHIRIVDLHGKYWDAYLSKNLFGVIRHRQNQFMKKNIKIGIIFTLFLIISFSGWFAVNWYCAGLKDVLVLSREGNIKELKYVVRWRPERVKNYHYDEAGATPLFCAASRGQLEVTKLLLDIKVDIDPRTSEGVTSLFEAVDQGNIEIVKILLNDGANVNAKIVAGWTPLDCAINNKREDIVKLLRNYGGKSCWEDK